MAMRRLVLCVNRDCQRLNRIHVNVGHLLQEPVLLGLGLSHFLQPLLVESIEQVGETCDEQTEKNKGPATTVDRGIEEGAGRSSRDLRDRSPNQTLLRREDASFAGSDTEKRCGGRRA